MKNVENGKTLVNTDNPDSGSQTSDEIGLADQAFAMELDGAMHYRDDCTPNSLNKNLQSRKSNETPSSNYLSLSSDCEKVPLKSISVKDFSKLNVNKNTSKSYP